VGTLAEMQGQERDVVIISLTRSQVGEENLCSNSVLGFLTDEKRANVLITRAKKLVIFVGCAGHFSDSEDATWRQILAFSQFLHESWD
jgi:ATP-dependent RNA/DNA helicase IGHMBP2